MLLKEKDGIICDKCSKIYRHDFSYYSVEICKILVQHGATVHRTNAILDIDICEECYQNILETCRKYLHSNPRSIKCENCGKLHNGNFEYYYMIFSDVTVTPPSDASDDVGYSYDIEVDKNVMDIRFDTPCFEELQATVRKIRDEYTRSLEIKE